MPVIGFLNDLSPDQWQSVLPGFRRALGEAGFVEGRNVTFAYRWTEGQRDRLPELAGDLARADVDLIVANGDTAAALAARAATSRIPILFAIEDDPVKFGLGVSLDKPGGNATGVYLVDSSGALGRTRHELLQQLDPKIGSIFWSVQILDASSDDRHTEPEKALAHLLDGVRMRTAGPVGADMTRLLRTDPEAALEQLRQQIGTPGSNDRITTGMVRSLEIVSGPFLDRRRRSQTIGLAALSGIPTLYHWRAFVEAGGLISHGFDIDDVYAQMGGYAGAILQGTDPAGMPVLKPTKIETAINLRTAAALGLSVPAALLARADKVIQ